MTPEQRVLERMKVYQIVLLYVLSILANHFILGMIWISCSGWYFGAKDVIPELYWYSGILTGVLVYLNVFRIQLHYRLLSAILVIQCVIVILGVFN